MNDPLLYSLVCPVPCPAALEEDEPGPTRLLACEATDPRVAVLDLDGTLVDASAGMALLEGLVEEGRVSAEVPSYVRSVVGQVDGVRAAYDAYARAIAGLSPAAVSAAAERVWAEERRRVFPYARPAVSLLKSRGFTVVLLSGSPHEIVARAAADLGCDDAYGSRFRLRGGVYSGGVDATPGVAGAKGRFVVGRPHLLVLGNSMADASLLARACRPVVFEPSAELDRLARDSGWPVVDRRSALSVLAAQSMHCGSANG
ncbi:HAD-IB family phosphatase [Streptomyces sp. NPDC007861]|uniref:HAD family hydrolase n=1 Tax=Streptomyces sp. NPDC007861 TaxID=3154893 RepID=UPI0033D037EC